MYFTIFNFFYLVIQKCCKKIESESTNNSFNELNKNIADVFDIMLNYLDNDYKIKFSKKIDSLIIKNNFINKEKWPSIQCEIYELLFLKFELFISSKIDKFYDLKIDDVVTNFKKINKNFKKDKRKKVIDMVDEFRNNLDEYLFFKIKQIKNKYFKSEEWKEFEEKLKKNGCDLSVIFKLCQINIEENINSNF